MRKPTSKPSDVSAGACERVDGVTVLPPKRGCRKIFVTGLLARGDVRKVPQDGGIATGVGRQPDAVAMVITAVDHEAIGCLPASSAAAASEPAETASGAMGLGADAHAPAGAGETAAKVVPMPKATKQTLILDLLAMPGGASLAELAAATAWLPHTVRAALVRLRQKGRAIERTRNPEGVSRYRLASDGAAAASSPAATAA